MTDGVLAQASVVGQGELEAFLTRFFSPAKVAFLTAHGDWWHRGPDNRWVVVCGGEIAAYSAVIPLRCRVGDEMIDAVWWIDLVVAPEHRGKGFQRLFDERVRRCAPLLLGFPNHVAAKIHRTHGWGVRNDLRVQLLPLRGEGLTARAPSRLRAAAAVGWPLAWVATRAVGVAAAHAGAGGAAEIDGSEAPKLAGILEGRGWSPAQVGTVKDEVFVRWRFLDSPHRDQLRFYVGWSDDSPSIVVVTRALVREGVGRIVRILDVLGDLSDRTAVRRAVNLALRDAKAGGAGQIACLAAHRGLRSTLRGTGFLLSVPARFCWLAGDAVLHERLRNASLCWSYADSDNDAVA